MGILHSLGQNQNNQWRFGNGGGISFNTTPPAFVAGSSISTYEGSASVADRTTGALLFYSDGVTVWNAQDQIMPNGAGLLGGTSLLLSSTTAAVIIPRPGNNDQYFLVTIDEQSSNNGIRYSIVDMTLDGGLGDIVTGQKNIPVYLTTSEKLEVVPASDRQGYWLISHDLPGNSFLAFKVSSAGIQNTPVISTLGGTQGNGSGHLKINRQFNKLAMGNLFDGTIELYEFNNTTGVVSNSVIWNSNLTSSPNIYGLEFSPNGKYLYVTNTQDVIRQYDISLGSSAAIQNSAYDVISGSFAQPASLQLGPNQKIYVNAGSIGVIDCPNLSGPACSFRQNGVVNQTGGGGYGLPKWVYYFSDTSQPTETKIISNDSCKLNPIPFSILANSEVVSVSWDFGDPSSGLNNSSSNINTIHIFSTAGNYLVTANVTFECETVTLFFPIQIFDCITPCTPPVASIGGATILNCSITSTTVTATGGGTYSWDNGLGTNASATITSPGTYTVTVTGTNGCTSSSSVVVSQDITLPTAGITGDNILDCTKNSTTFTASGGGTYSWDNGLGTNASATITSPDTYTVTVTGTNGCTSSSSVVVSQDITLPTAVITGGNVLDCTTTSATITATGGGTYSWDNGLGSNASATTTSPGSYTVTVTGTNGCTSSSSVIITDCPNECQLFLPSAFSPNGDGINDLFRPKASCSIENYELHIYNQWGENIFSTLNPQVGWNGVYKGVKCNTGNFVYSLKYKLFSKPTQFKKGSIILIR